ncbi:hypothetical protein [Streptomyces sp. NPDC017260]|uniref:hypothetical protein n=1 Tax=unclassified Streptomyces TaxID=2593676 RepID=UPI00378816E0
MASALLLGRPPGDVVDEDGYYKGDEAQNNRSRNRICPTGWAANNGDASALADAADTLNCDEFAFASSGTYAKKHGSMVHLFSLNGTDLTFSEVCGRSVISGMHNQESMGGHFANSMKQMRIKDKDAYWLDTRMDDGGTCHQGVGGQPVICQLAAQ